MKKVEKGWKKLKTLVKKVEKGWKKLKKAEKSWKWKDEKIHHRRVEKSKKVVQHIICD